MPSAPLPSAVQRRKCEVLPQASPLPGTVAQHAVEGVLPAAGVGDVERVVGGAAEAGGAVVGEDAGADVGGAALDVAARTAVGDGLHVSDRVHRDVVAGGARRPSPRLPVASESSTTSDERAAGPAGTGRFDAEPVARSAALAVARGHAPGDVDANVAGVVAGGDADAVPGVIRGVHVGDDAASAGAVGAGDAHAVAPGAGDRPAPAISTSAQSSTSTPLPPGGGDVDLLRRGRRPP